jgi:hypothetical protein
VFRFNHLTSSTYRDCAFSEACPSCSPQLIQSQRGAGVVRRYTLPYPAPRPSLPPGIYYTQRASELSGLKLPPPGLVYNVCRRLGRRAAHRGKPSEPAHGRLGILRTQEDDVCHCLPRWGCVPLRPSVLVAGPLPRPDADLDQTSLTGSLIISISVPG